MKKIIIEAVLDNKEGLFNEPFNTHGIIEKIQEICPVSLFKYKFVDDELKAGCQPS